jgi:hypothetical protein
VVNPKHLELGKKRGYITEKPTGFKENVLNEFKNKIFETQGPFGGVSTLTPVEQVSASNPNWRSDIYQREGLAGPLSNQGFSSGYGGRVKKCTTFYNRKRKNSSSTTLYRIFSTIRFYFT